MFICIIYSGTPTQGCSLGLDVSVSRRSRDLFSNFSVSTLSREIEEWSRSQSHLVQKVKRFGLVSVSCPKQLLADQTIAPHWATEAQGSVELTTSRAANRDADD